MLIIVTYSNCYENNLRKYGVKEKTKKIKWYTGKISNTKERSNGGLDDQKGISHIWNINIKKQM